MIEPKHFRISKAHRLLDVDYASTPNQGGDFREDPSLVVVHDTAGASLASSVSWLRDRRAKASAHLVIGRGGEVVQLVPFNKVAWHAGRSRYRGRVGCNAFSIGIEHDNPGRLDWIGRSSFKRRYKGGQFVRTPEHGAGWWLDYTEEQLAASLGVVLALRERYPSLVHLEPHWAISPGRKVDTNPLFPLETFRTALAGRRGEADPEMPDSGPYGVVTTDLRLRRWPSNADNIIVTMPAGARVQILRSGEYADGFPLARWHFVRWGGREGWAHSSYIDERW